MARNAQDNGIWAWDCILSEVVVIIPFVLALLGDNPMQSELSCHIGMLGKFFCRVCYVKGTDQSMERDTEKEAKSNETNYESDAVSIASSDVSASQDPGESPNEVSCNKSTAVAKESGRRKKDESLAELVGRTRDFLRVLFFFHFESDHF